METRKVVRKLLGLMLAVSFFASSIAENAYAATYILWGHGHDSATFKVDITALDIRYRSYFDSSRLAWNNANCPASITTGANTDHVIASGSYSKDTRYGWITPDGLNAKKRCTKFKIMINTYKTTEAYAQSVMVHELGHALNLHNNPNNANCQYDSSIMNYGRNRKTLKKPTSWDAQGVRASY